MMLILALPMIVGYGVLGAAVGVAVGRRLWGGVGAAALGTLLGLTPLAVGYLALALMIVAEQKLGQ